MRNASRNPRSSICMVLGRLREDAAAGSTGAVKFGQPPQMRCTYADQVDGERQRRLRHLLCAGLMTIEMCRIYPILEASQHFSRRVSSRVVYRVKLINDLTKVIRFLCTKTILRCDQFKYVFGRWEHAANCGFSVRWCLGKSFHCPVERVTGIGITLAL